MGFGSKNKQANLQNFINNSDDFHFGRGVLQKSGAEHIKCIYVCKKEFFNGRKESKRYLVGFLTDSNKFSIVNYNDKVKSDTNLQYAGVARLKRFSKMFAGKNIDKNTFLVINEDELDIHEFFPSALLLMRTFIDLDYRGIHTWNIVKAIDDVYSCLTAEKIDKKKRNKQIANAKFHIVVRWMNKLYSYILQNKLCPWIDGNSQAMELSRKKVAKRRGSVNVELGLFASMIMKYNKIKTKKA